MKVVICGAGQVGWQIARHLAAEHNDVSIIDKDPEQVRRATDLLDVQGFVGFASYPDVLERAGARDADWLIAATQSDEVNMVICQVAHSIFAVPRKVARLRAQSYLDALYSDLYRRDHMPIDVVISPEHAVAEAAMQRLAAPAAFDVEYFMDGMVQLLGIQLAEDCPVLETPLRQLSDLFSTLRAVVVGVRREGTLFVPDPDDRLLAGDQIYVVAHVDDFTRTLEAFGKAARRRERVVIVGGGNVGLRIARRLEKGTDRVRAKVIERNRAVAENAADALERTIVLNGDGLDLDVLQEAGIDRADAILAVTDDDKTNLLVCARAKSLGCEMAICLINDPTLASLMRPLSIDAVINPRATTVSSILRHVRPGRVRAVYSIGDAEAEVIETEVLSPSALEGKRLRDLSFPEGAIVAAVRKGGSYVRPGPEVALEAGDAVVIFTLAADAPDVQRLAEASAQLF
ncbi:MAG: Trk system potassium transporter TrkA [Alphaproteobacteria bacterium]|nr:MAG: Trk system potassium transporter TrkA [Alphaproteobacteria bacterium]